MAKNRNQEVEAEATETNADVATDELKASRRKFTPEQIAEIRALRAEKKEDGKPVHSHAALAAQFDTKAGVISHIVRNLSYADPNYTPVNDMDGRKVDQAKDVSKDQAELDVDNAAADGGSTED